MVISALRTRETGQLAFAEAAAPAKASAEAPRDAAGDIEMNLGDGPSGFELFESQRGGGGELVRR